VGKTTIVRKLGSSYAQYIELNLERDNDAKLFERISDIHSLTEAIFLLHNKSIQQQDTLLFIDEIQAVPEAINQLRYFYEEVPWLHVIAAGSLLETLLHENLRIPVGRVEYAILRPVAFDEYLRAINEPGLYEAWNRLPLPAFAQDLLLEHFHKFGLIGGMPEVVQQYAQHSDLQELGSIYRALNESYKNDVEKYARNSSMVQILRHTIEALPGEAGQRIKFEGFGRSHYGSREMGEALRTLQKAMLLYLLYPTTQTEFPLLPNKRKSPRLQMLDTGLMNFYSGLQPQLILIKDLNTIHSGRVIEHLVGQELLATTFDIDYRLQWWTREEKHSKAEVDFLLPVDGHIIPIEVKSGATGTLRSLLMFMDKVPHHWAIRLYAGNLVLNEANTPEGKPIKLLNLPYFLAGKVEAYAKWLMSEHP
jgi:predicted AAA+ superfamily ATPase